MGSQAMPPAASAGLSRRRLLGTAVAAVPAAFAAPAVLRADSPASRVRVGVMGLGTRGMDLSRVIARRPNVEIAYVADVDSTRAGQAAEAIGKIEGVERPPQAIGDFRRFLDDASVDVVVVTTGNHWHAPATILACKAGKHVYVEKPCSHNPWEGEMMVAAAAKHGRKVQMGNQRRSWPMVRKAIAELHAGVIGRVYLAQASYANRRPSIGRGKEAAVPAYLDWDLWQGPATRRPFHDNYVPYHWHWFWHWGNGELGNNGIHTLDVCRWGMGVDLPTRVASVGGRYRYDDDQQTPDTQTASYEFGDRGTITWQGCSCVIPPARMTEIMFYGEKGSLGIGPADYWVFDESGKEIRAEKGERLEVVPHVANLFDAVRDDVPLNSPIDVASTSTLMCHLGNIAHRVGRSLRCDPATGRILDDADAMKLWKRDYEPGWEPTV